tara:strand:- start:113 stop:337 length:225 start_codon:yes stop_codon:yes gene_type:complete
MSILYSILAVPVIIFVAVGVFLAAFRLIEKLDRDHMIFGNGSDGFRHQHYYAIIAALVSFLVSGLALYFISGLF